MWDLYYLPLYLLCAWLRSDHDLARRLKYKLPFSLRSQMPCIWRFWFFDLVFSLIAFAAVVLVTQRAPGLWPILEQLTGFHMSSGDPTLDITTSVLLTAVAGLLWPVFATFSVGREGSKQAVSIARLRDFFLDGSAVESLDREMHIAIDAYFDRVFDRARVSAPLWGRLYDIVHESANPPEPTPEEMDNLRAAVIEKAQSDFLSIFRGIAIEENIAFLPTRNGLMQVSGMKSTEATLLRKEGVPSAWALARLSEGRTVAELSRTRIIELRYNARSLLFSRARRAALGLSIVLVVTVPPVISARARWQPTPKGGAQRVSPLHAISPEAALAAGAYAAPSPGEGSLQ